MTDHAATSGPTPLTPEWWARLAPLVDAALDLPPAGRAAYLAAVGRRDPRLGAELGRLLVECDRQDALFDQPAGERFALLFGRDDGDDEGSELRALLQQALGDRYVLERELEGAGMSRVFVVDEPALGRKLVVKVVAPERLARRSARRFEQEISLAASLQQANIVPLLWTGHAGGYAYYAMPFVDGQSLRDRLARDGMLPIGDAISVLRDVARALAYAHERGVVHRDIKPGNVLLSGGTAVVSDFGIAKALGAAHPRETTRDDARDGAPDDARVFTAEAALGTPGYMAPEQASGDPATDHRADIYAFGCLAYAVLTGQPPFRGGGHDEVIAAHLQQTPTPLGERRPEIPVAIAALVAGCLRKDPAARPQSAAALLRVLDGAPGGQTAGRARGVRAAVLAAGALVAVVTVAAAGYWAQRARGAGARYEAAPLSLAVIPFRNVARDTAVDYLAAGMADELHATMRSVPGVHVAGRSAASRYGRQPDVTARTIERELGTRFLVTGTLEVRGGRLVASAQLEDSAAVDRLWSGSYERRVGEFSAMSNEIARAVTRALGKHLGPGTGLSAESAEAVDLYLRGQALLARRGPGIATAAGFFERAIALDPRFARAHASLAMALAYYPYFIGVAPDEVRDRAANAAHRALALDSMLAEAHTALGVLHAHDGRWAEASQEFERALVLDPDDAEAHLHYGRLLVNLGRSAQAMVELGLARRSERISPVISAWMAYAWFLEGNADSALAESEQALRLDSLQQPATNLSALINLGLGRREVARRIIPVIPLRVGMMSNAPYVYATLGDTLSTRRVMREMESNTPPPWFVDAARATVFLGAGDTARALDALERSEKSSGAMWIVYLPVRDPAYDRLRSSARFAALIRHAGLDSSFLLPAGGRGRLMPRPERRRVPRNAAPNGQDSRP